MFGNHNQYDADDLHDYTDAVIKGEGAGPLADDEELAQLQQLALRLDTIMRPAEPRQEFVSGLRDHLYAQHAELQPVDERVMRTKRVFNKVVSIFAATAVVSHVIGALVVVVTFIIERGRRDRTAAAA